MQLEPGLKPIVSDGAHDRFDGKRLWLPCGKCIGCRTKRVQSWAIRCMHEAQMHETSSFITLTYSPENYSPSLNYPDFQRFMKRLRKAKGHVRFFACGEYGELTQRPHFHACLFGTTFKPSYQVSKLTYASKELEQLWPLGHSSFGDVTYDSAAYVARYTVAKVSGPLADSHYVRVDTRTGEYVRVVPELAHMSLKPGIGATWFNKYWREVYDVRDAVVRVGGQEVPPPRYYDRLLETLDGDLWEAKQLGRYVRSEAFCADGTPDRLKVREICATAKLQFLKRSLQ